MAETIKYCSEGWRVEVILGRRRCPIFYQRLSSMAVLRHDETLTPRRKVNLIQAFKRIGKFKGLHVKMARGQ